MGELPDVLNVAWTIGRIIVWNERSFINLFTDRSSSIRGWQESFQLIFVESACPLVCTVSITGPTKIRQSTFMYVRFVESNTYHAKTPFPINALHVRCCPGNGNLNTEISFVLDPEPPLEGPSILFYCQFPFQVWVTVGSSDIIGISPLTGLLKIGTSNRTSRKCLLFFQCYVRPLKYWDSSRKLHVA